MNEQKREENIMIEYEYKFRTRLVKDRLEEPMKDSFSILSVDLKP